MDDETCFLHYFKMSKEMECIKKKRIQPCITSMLSPSAELIAPNATNSDPIEVPFQSVKSKKRKRSRKSGEHSDNKPNKKTITKTSDKMSDPVPNHNSKDTSEDKNPDGIEENGIELSPELKELEK